MTVMNQIFKNKFKLGFKSRVEERLADKRKR